MKLKKIIMGSMFLYSSFVLAENSTVGTWKCEKNTRLIFNESNVTMTINGVDSLMKLRKYMIISSGFTKSKNIPNVYLYKKLETDKQIELWMKTVNMGNSNADKKAGVLRKEHGTIIIPDKRGNVTCQKL